MIKFKVFIFECTRNLVVCHNFDSRLIRSLRIQICWDLRNVTPLTEIFRNIAASTKSVEIVTIGRLYPK